MSMHENVNRDFTLECQVHKVTGENSWSKRLSECNVMGPTESMVFMFVLFFLILSKSAVQEVESICKEYVSFLVWFCSCFKTVNSYAINFKFFDFQQNVVW